MRPSLLERVGQGGWIIVPWKLKALSQTDGMDNFGWRDQTNPLLLGWWHFCNTVPLWRHSSGWLRRKVIWEIYTKRRSQSYTREAKQSIYLNHERNEGKQIKRLQYRVYQLITYGKPSCMDLTGNLSLLRPQTDLFPGFLSHFSPKKETHEATSCLELAQTLQGSCMLQGHWWKCSATPHVHQNCLDFPLVQVRWWKGHLWVV